MKRFTIALLTAQCLAIGVAHAQQQAGVVTPQEGSAADRPPGPRIDSASFFADYYSNGLPANFNTQAAPLKSDVAYGGAVSMGWSHTGSKLTFNAEYTPSYTGRVRYSDLHAAGHNLLVYMNLQLSSKWNFNVNTTGIVADLQRTMFASSQSGAIASASSTYTGLSSALVSGQTANPQLGGILTSPVTNSPLAAVLYGNQYLTVGVFSGLTYTHSERFHFTIGGGGVRAQSLSQTVSTGITAPIPVTPRTTNLNVRVSASYGLTPRLTLTGDWNGNRLYQSHQGTAAYSNSFIQTGQGRLSYLAGTNWLFSVGAGLGILPTTNVITTTGAAQTGHGTRYLADGSIAYKFYSQTIVARVSRSVTNSYGFGAADMVMGDLGWNWRRPGSGWSVMVDAGYQDLSGTQALSTTLAAWRGTAMLTRMLGHRTAVSANYALMRSTGVYSGINYGLTRGAAQVALIWFFRDQTGSTNDSHF